MSVAYDRPENDFYQTPDAAVLMLLRAWETYMLPPRRILEPAAGGQALLGPLREMWPDAEIVARDLAPGPGDEGIVEQCDFWLDDRPEVFDAVITNPPYNIAEIFVRQSMTKVRRGGHVAMLLHGNFLGTAERADLWKTMLPEWIFVLPFRPAYKAGRTYNVWSGWYVWTNGPRRKFTKLVVL